VKRALKGDNDDDDEKTQIGAIPSKTYS